MTIFDEAFFPSSHDSQTCDLRCPHPIHPAIPTCRLLAYAHIQNPPRSMRPFFDIGAVVWDDVGEFYFKACNRLNP